MNDNLTDQELDLASKKYDWFVQQQAAKLGKVFFTDSGEGRDTFYKGMYVENISGWLVPIGEVNLFRKNLERKYDQEFDKYYVFAEWSLDNNQLTVEFKQYPTYYD